MTASRGACRSGIRRRAAHLLVSPVGIAGGLSGVNARGLAVSAACLLDVASRQHRAGSSPASFARSSSTPTRSTRHCPRPPDVRPHALHALLSETATGRAVMVEVDGARHPDAGADRHAARRGQPPRRFDRRTGALAPIGPSDWRPSLSAGKHGDRIRTGRAAGPVRSDPATATPPGRR